ncbi:hypothetical protein GLF_0868 [Gluconobacter frateurii NBRC 101659]|uniref:hypothetical protein n=1 Tax=Gluconobacter japonicus TaxID=376620 RepID=UPI00029B09EE|nr:hypothetical protein GLF_0868 [Gluconobacter frateurii NBRC 101659]
MRSVIARPAFRGMALIGAFATVLSLGGCQGNYDPGSRALGGGLLGGGTGAAIGALAGGGRGAAIGALAGGALGAATGAVTTPNRPGYQQGGYQNGYPQQQGNYPQQGYQQNGQYPTYPQQQYRCPPNTNCQNGYPQGYNNGYPQQSTYGY